MKRICILIAAIAGTPASFLVCRGIRDMTSFTGYDAENIGCEYGEYGN